MSDQQSGTSTVGNMVDGAPWWVKVGLTIYLTVGLPTALVVWDKLQGAGVIPNPVQTTLEALREEFHTDQEDLNKKLQELSGVVIQQAGTMKVLNEQIAKEIEAKQRRCVMRAQTEQDKRDCFASKE